jgi:hypothetical protein
MLKTVPTEDHLARMYYELSLLGASAVGAKKRWPYTPNGMEDFMALAADMSRYDPRLFCLLVSFIHANWKKIDPLVLRMKYASMRTPEAIAVIAEFLIALPEISREEYYFLEYLQRGLKPVAQQFFYQHLYSPGGSMGERAVEAPLREYKKWGFLACESPILDEATRRTAGTRDAHSRKNILIRLLAQNDSIGISDYLEALENKISRQQALLDVRSIKGIKRIGRGRGARWKNP